MLDATSDTMTYSVTFEDDAVWVALNRADTVNAAGGLPEGDFVDELTGDMHAGPTAMVPARSALVLTRP
jgi:hypothetical protein